MSQLVVIRPEKPSRWSRFTESVRSVWSGPLTSSSPELKKIWAAPDSSTGVGVSETTALNYSAVWAAVSLIASQVASLPLILYKRRKEGGKDRYVESKLYRLLHDEFNPEMTSYVGREIMEAHTLTWGNGYAEIERDAMDRPLHLWPLTPDRVTPVRDKDTGAIVYRVTNTSQSDGYIPARDMLHIPGLGFDGLVGYSVIAKARETIGLGLAAERFGGKFFGNGATFGGVLSHPNALKDKALKNLRESLEARHQGVDRAHKFLILEEGAKYERLGIPPNDAQFLETRQFQIPEICRWFNIPPHKLRDLSRATFSNIEMQAIEFVTDTLRPWLVRWEQEINRKLISPSERNIQFAEHLVDGLLRGDIQSRYTALGIARDKGIINADEWREIENWNPQPDGQGKLYLVQSAQIPAAKLAEMVDAQIEKLKTPPPAPPPPPAKDPNVDAANARAASAEQLASEARADATRERDARVAAEAAGVATVVELERLRATEQAASSTAAQLTLLADELRAQATALQVAHDAAVADRDTARAQADAAERRADEDRNRADAAAAAGEAARLAAQADVAAAQAAVRTAEAALAALETAGDAERAAATAEADALRARAATAQAEFAARDADLVAARAALALAEQRVTDETAARTAADTARATAETAAEAGRESERARLTAVIAAHRTLIADAMGRMIRRETEKARRQQATPEKLQRWADAFYQTHEDTCIEALLPAIRTHLAWRSAPDDPVAVTSQFVREHIVESQRQLRAVLDGAEPEEFAPLLERTLARWETDRPSALADRILRDEVEYVRSYR